MSEDEPMRVASTAWIFVIPLTLVGIGISLVGWPVCAGFFFLLALYCLFFFRDPKREIPTDEGTLVCPADGKVDEIETVCHPDFPGGRAVKIGIFLSVFDVHINRAPITGSVMRKKHRKGRFLSAMNKASSRENESNLLVFMTDKGPVHVKQIAGLIARRIVCTVKRGQEVKTGERIGLICFGSRTESYMPTHFVVKVKIGMRVQGGSTILAIVPGADQSESR